MHTISANTIVNMLEKRDRNKGMHQGRALTWWLLGNNGQRRCTELENKSHEVSNAAEEDQTKPKRSYKATVVDDSSNLPLRYCALSNTHSAPNQSTHRFFTDLNSPDATRTHSPRLNPCRNIFAIVSRAVLPDRKQTVIISHAENQERLPVGTRVACDRKQVGSIFW